MNGYVMPPPAPGASPGDLRPWEALVVDAVGNVIAFWGFKRNQGRIWALLYLRDRPLAAAEIQRALGLSKGAVSMLCRELERWGVLRRVHAAGEARWRFLAETDLLKMIGRVIEERELAMVGRVRADIQRAQEMARTEGALPRETAARLRRIAMLAGAMDRAIRVFLRTARLDIGRAASVLARPLSAARRGS